MAGPAGSVAIAPNQREDQTMNKREAATEGFDRGWNIASWQDMPEIGHTLPKDIDWQGIGTIETVPDQIDAWEMYCYESESNDRDFSPFERTAHDINESRWPEENWEAFDEGIARGVRAYRRKHHKLADLRKDARAA